MPLPQQVINQISQESTETPGVLSGMLLFSGAILALSLVLYLGLMFVYQPYLNSQLAAIQNKVATTDQSVDSANEAQLLAFYSQVVNLQSLLSKHVFFSQFLGWLEQNTESNVFYSQFSFASADQITLSAVAASEAAATQQIAIFESSPEIQKLSVSGVSLSNAGTWTFSATLIMNPSLFTANALVPTTATTSTTP